MATTRHNEALGWQYGLALIRDGRTTGARSVEIYQNLTGEERETYTALVVPPHFCDLDGVRLRP